MLRVLHVDDRHDFREAFKQNLYERFPHMDIEEAECADEALLKIKRTPPDLIFMDIRMPGMNGLELAQKIKNDFPRIRIAMVTGYDFPEYRRGASQHGVERD